MSLKDRNEKELLDKYNKLCLKEKEIQDKKSPSP